MSPRAQAPGAKPSKQDPPVDWRARSQGLEAFARIMASRFPGTWIAVKANAALGLPDEEGEDEPNV